MSSAQWNAGQAHGEAQVIFADQRCFYIFMTVLPLCWNYYVLWQAKTEEWVKSAQNTANKACDKMADSRESAQHGKEQSAGFIQQVQA